MHRNQISVFSGVALTMLLVLTSSTLAQPSSQPCNEGRVGPPRTDPRSSGMHCMEPYGYMRGWLEKCSTVASSEGFGSDVIALGDVNHDTIADFAVERTRCDTNSNLSVPIESYVYFGVRRGLPNSKNGQRIGPREIFSETRVLCSGDWDNDGNRDLLTRVRLLNDTSEQNPGYHIQRVVVFWGHHDGIYSIDDTTRLTVAATDLWIGAYRAVSTDLNSDKVDDLVIWGGGGLQGGAAINTADLHFFTGHRNARWGSNGILRRPDMAWWNIPPTNYLQLADQDCDGHPDIALINQYHSTAFGTISVLYGRTGALPDTNEVETVNLDSAGGHYTLLADVTGDHVPEIVTNCGSQEVVKIFAGQPGRRLRAQYGTGNEKGKPWLNIDLPYTVNPHDWFSTGFETLYDLGDGDGDGTADVWTYSFPFFVQYATSFYFDRFIDAGMRWTVVTSATRIGDIDGSGYASIAVGFSGTPGGLAFYHVGDSLRLIGELIDLPHPEDFKCESTATVKMSPSSKDDAVALDVLPNPSRGEMAVAWRVPDAAHRDAAHDVNLRLVDGAGAEVMRRILPAGQTTVTIPTTGIAPGFYLLILQCGTHSSAVKVVVQ